MKAHNYILYRFYCIFDIKLPTFFRGKGMFREKTSIPENIGFEIGKNTGFGIDNSIPNWKHYAAR
jgi:hypothetical protein